jgi:hypothetical protein
VFASLTAYTVIASYWTTLLLIGDREDVDDPKDLNAKTKIALNDRTAGLLVLQGRQINQLADCSETCARCRVAGDAGLCRVV